MFNIGKLVAGASALTIALTIGSITPTWAQAPLGDQALTRLNGKWVSDHKGRTIAFKIKDFDGVFEDEVEPGVTLTGTYRRDDNGAGYVLHYAKGFKCRYNLNVIASDELKSEINLRLISPSDPDAPSRFRCIEGTLKRMPQT